jgi:hypothetical protein
VAEVFKGRARAAQLVLVDGTMGAMWAPRGWPLVVFDFTSIHGKIIEIDMIADPERLRQLDLAALDE